MRTLPGGKSIHDKVVINNLVLTSFTLQMYENKINQEKQNTI